MQPFILIWNSMRTSFSRDLQGFAVSNATALLLLSLLRLAAPTLVIRPRTRWRSLLTAPADVARCALVQHRLAEPPAP